MNDDELVQSLAANALAYRDSCAAPMWKHKQQAQAVLDALSRAGYAVVGRDEPWVTPSIPA